MVRKHEEEIFSEVLNLALKMAIKGMSIQAIADILEVQPATVSYTF